MGQAVTTLYPFQADLCGQQLVTLLQTHMGDALKAAAGTGQGALQPPTPVHFAYGAIAAGFRTDGPLLWVSDGAQVPQPHGNAAGWYPVACTYSVSVTWRYDAGDLALIPRLRSRYAEAVRQIVDTHAATAFAGGVALLGGYAYAIDPVRLEPGEIGPTTSDEIIAEVTVYGGLSR